MTASEKTRMATHEVGHQPIYQDADVRTLGELLNDLSEDFGILVRKEVALARTETMEKLRQATRGVVIMVAAGLLAYAGVIALLIAVADLLYAAIGVYWISSAIVGVAVLLVAAILYAWGRSALRDLSVTPDKTMETLRNDAQWVKEQVR